VRQEIESEQTNLPLPCAFHFLTPPVPPLPQVYVPSHPLCKHWLAVARNAAAPPPVFRSALAELGRNLIYEAVAQDWLPTLDGQVETPCGTADCTFVDPNRPVKVVPILRAGLVLLEQAGTVLPQAETYHVGYARDEATLMATPYLNKLPASLSPDDRILVVDTMLATGGTVVQVMADLVARGADVGNVRLVCAVVAPPALKALGERFPRLKVYAGMIDAELDERGYIVPGLGDAGDRAFGTL
jgi:uracil phosphoribosyltransferase